MVKGYLNTKLHFLQQIFAVFITLFLFFFFDYNRYIMQIDILFAGHCESTVFFPTVSTVTVLC